MLTVLDLFSGIGGFSYAAEQLVGGFKTVAFCDSDELCRRVLRKHWPDTPIFTDVRSLSAEDITPLCPNGLSLITAGFPCQDLSVAGKQAGYDGERSVLFYEIIRLVRELRPNFLLLENVRNLLSHKSGETFQETLFQIAKAGYDAEWAVIPASDLGACHKRERIWITAYANDTQRRTNDSQWSDYQSAQRLQGWKKISSGSSKLHEDAPNTNSQRQPQQFTSNLSDEKGQSRWSNATSPLSPDWREYVSVPVLRRGDDGLSHRVDRLKQLGNSIVPQVAAVPLRRIKELAKQMSQ